MEGGSLSASARAAPGSARVPSREGQRASRGSAGGRGDRAWWGSAQTASPPRALVAGGRPQGEAPRRLPASRLVRGARAPAACVQMRACACAGVQMCVCVRVCSCAAVCIVRARARVWSCVRARAPGRGASGPGGRQEEELCRLRMNVLEGARRGGTERQRRGARSGGPSAGAGGGGGTGRTRSRARGRDAARGRGPGLGRRWWPRAAADLPAPLAGCRARPCSGRRGEPAGSFPPGVFGEEAGREEDGEGRRGELVRPPERGPL